MPLPSRQPGRLPWAWAGPRGRAVLASGSSGAQGRPGPRPPARQRRPLWTPLSWTGHGSTGSPCAGREEGGAARLLQEQPHTHTHTHALRSRGWCRLAYLIYTTPALLRNKDAVNNRESCTDVSISSQPLLKLKTDDDNGRLESVFLVAGSGSGSGLGVRVTITVRG